MELYKLIIYSHHIQNRVLPHIYSGVRLPPLHLPSIRPMHRHRSLPLPIPMHHRRRRQLPLIHSPKSIIPPNTPSHTLQLPRKEIPLLLHHIRALVAAHDICVSAQMPPVRQTAQGLFERKRLVDFCVDVGAREPVVAEFGAAVEVDCCDDAHVALAPFAAAIGDLRLK